MILRTLILAFAIALHILTPHWFLKDFLTIADWIMIFCGFLSLFIYKSVERDKKIFILSFLLSLNVLVYYVTTVQMLTLDGGDDRMSYRLQVIFRTSVNIPMNFGEGIEIFNVVQIVLSIINSILLLIQFYKKKYPSNI